MQYQSSLTGKREKKDSGCMHNSFICKEKCACKNKQPDDVIRTATLTLQRTILSQRESQTDGLPVDSHALVTQIQSDSAPLFLDEQCPV